jgi:uncharacterized protein YdhG (YjbR/CyaY superfamily)
MKSKPNEFKTIDEYISTFPKDVQKILQKIRETIHKAAPRATEVISYGVPAFKQNSVLVYFAAFKNHIGFYPTANPIKMFSKELTAYETSKGTIRFPLKRKIPLSLITRITKFRVREDLEKHSLKKQKIRKQI